MKVKLNIILQVQHKGHKGNKYRIQGELKAYN